MDPLVARLDRAFNPRTLVVVGDKSASNYEWIRSYKTFAGNLCSVQIDPREIPGIEELGVKNFLSLRDVPGPIDHVLFAVPRKVAPLVLQECIELNVGSVCLFTSGFAETGEPLGIELQEKVTRMALEAGLPLIGPNCMGVYVPKLGIRQGWTEQPIGEAGPVGLISQSGTHAMFISMLMAAQGVKISKGVSIGNATVIDAADHLEYLGEDPETQIIAAYLEGVRKGRKFFETLRRVARRKPVVIWKGGQTPAGARATASHTASLATPGAIWLAMMRQCGAIAVETMDELVDVCKALLFVKGGIGNRLGLLAMTGGPSVAITDAFARQDLAVPTLSESSYSQLAEFFNIIGGSYRNPLDIGGTIRGDTGNLDRLLKIVGDDENVDTLVMEVQAGYAWRRWRENPESLRELIEILANFRAAAPKPFLTVLQPMWVEEVVAELRPRFTERGIASFHSFDRAARALRLVRDHHRWAAGLE